MAEDKGYPWQCERDGINAAEVCRNPNPLATQRGHTETHNSKTGERMESEEK